MRGRLIHISIVLLFTPFFASAAELYFDVVPKEAKVGDTVVATLFLDPEGETINALEGGISYGPELSVLQVRNGDSLVTFWIQQPEAKGDSISYAGIVPGGYQGNVSPNWKGFAPGKVFTVVFRAEKEGDTWIQAHRESVVLLHDGKGTKASLTLKDATFSVRKKDAEEKEETPPAIVSWDDTIQPEPFNPVIIQEKGGLFGGKYYVIFETADKQSGIDHYEVQEGNGSFVVAKSPYTLKHQGRDTVVLVKAVDKGGNSRIETILPTSEFAWYEKTIFRAAVFSFVLLGIAVMFVFVTRARKRK